MLDVVFGKKNPHIHGPVHFKAVLFKGHLYFTGEKEVRGEDQNEKGCLMHWEKTSFGVRPTYVQIHAPGVTLGWLCSLPREGMGS